MDTIMDTFIQSLLILLQGMAGIFVFMTILYLLILALDKVFQPRGEK